MSKLGNISGFLRQGGLADLDWLEAPPSDILPKQNLDCAPELEAIWRHEGEDPSAYLVPNSDKVDSLAELSHSNDPAVLEAAILRTARRHMMAVKGDLKAWQARMSNEFPQPDLFAAKKVLASVVAERGLLGGYYVAASDFCDCSQPASEDTKFVSKHAAKAEYVVAKTACEGCSNNRGGICGAFHKKLVVDLDYSPVQSAKVAARVGVSVSHSDPRKAIQAALVSQHTTTEKTEFSGIVNASVLIPATQLVRKSHQEDQANLDKLAFQKKLAAAQAMSKVASTTTPAAAPHYFVQGTPKARTAETLAAPTVPSTTGLLRLASQKMNEGLYGSALKNALLQKYSAQDFVSAKPELEKLLRNQGAQGSVFVDPTVYSDYGSGCRTAKEKLRGDQTVKYAKSGSKCSSCVHSNGDKCSVLMKTLVAKVPYEEGEKEAIQKAAFSKAASSQPKREQSIVREYDLRSTTGDIEFAPEAVAPDVVVVRLGNYEI